MKTTKTRARIGAAVLVPCLSAGLARGQALNEDFESFVVVAGASLLAPQSDWTGDEPANLFVVDLNAISGQSARHTSDDSRVPIADVQSPLFGRAAGTLELDVRISDTNALYQVRAIDPDSGMVVARVTFRRGSGGADPMVTSTLATGNYRELAESGPLASWSPGATHHLEFHLYPNGDTSALMDGVMLFHQPSASNAIPWLPFPRVGALHVWCENITQTPGSSDGTGSTITIDNVTFTPDTCPMDLNESGAVDAGDLASLLSVWSESYSAWDVNENRAVNGEDLAALLAAWGVCSDAD